jgi:hypothetical protein
MPEPVSLAVLRSWVHATAGILLHLAAVTQLPTVQADRLRLAARELQNVALSLADSPRIE